MRALKAFNSFVSEGFLTNASEFKIKQYASVDCTKRIKLPEKMENMKSKTLPLPVKFKLTGGSLNIISNNLLMFNRIAKVFNLNN